MLTKDVSKLIMFPVDSDYKIGPTNHMLFMSQTIPAVNVSAAIDAAVTSLGRNETRQVSVSRINVTTLKKTF